MKTLQEQYNQIQNGEGRKDLFLKEAKSKYPNLISNITSFNEAEKILKNKNVINENYVDLKPLNKITSDDLNPNKQSWENKFAEFLAEAGKKELNPIVNNEVEKKVNDKKGEEKIKAEEKETAKEVINTQDRNYDYSPKVDNINNVNAQEMMNGVYCEIKNDPNLSLEEAQAKVIKNLAKDSLHYVKEGQFGVEGLGYQEQKVEENSGKTYGGSGYSDKLKEGDSAMQPVKESKEDKLKSLIKEHLGGIATTGNPNSLAAMSGEVIRQMMNEDDWQQEVGSQYHSSLYTEENQEEELPMDEAKKDHDGDGDIDSDDYLAARDKAIKKAMGKKPKKESIDSKLAEIGKEGDIVKMEAQLDYLSEYIQEKVDRLNSINEDENLQELIDKKKMKQMQKEIKLLEKRKQKMEKLYEKHCGKKYQRPEMVDEVEEVDESFDSLVKKVDKEKGYDKKDAQRVAGFIANRKRAGAGSGPTAKMKKREG
tara:strand:- start:1827 stop:3269 length:1443 start_codon:yes stop_codon:yes gene_type:complete